MTQDTNTASGAAEIATRLRNACASVRNKSYPLADLIPLMQQAADALASAAAPAQQPTPSAAAAQWWRSRADEIEAQVAATGSTEAMRCYTDMRTLLQAATNPPPPTPQAAPSASPAVVPSAAITASVMRDDGGEKPAFCLMVSYRSEKDAMDALTLLATPTPQADSQPAPIDMVLHCPACGLQHIDAPDAWRPGSDPLWDNPPHRSHLCHGCGHIWRPADVPTNGMEAVKTRGKADSPIAARAPADSVTAPVGQPYGIVDPDYARVFTQARIIAWQYGYACVMHGSFTRDLDLLLVPWTEQAGDNHDQLLKLIAGSCGLRFLDGKEEVYESTVDFTEKPHGRKSCSLFFREFGDRRWIDISIVPRPLYATPPAQAADSVLEDAALIEQIAQQWDGCMYDAVGEYIDIGESIRSAARKQGANHD